MDATTREDIAAAVAVHRDLGADYTDAVSEGLVERIGLEIDKRVDARLAQPGPAAPRARTGQPGSVPLVKCLGSMASGLAASAIVLLTGYKNNGMSVITADRLLLVALIWAVIAIVNVNIAYPRRRR